MTGRSQLKSRRVKFPTQKKMLAMVLQRLSRDRYRDAFRKVVQFSVLADTEHRKLRI